MIETIKTLGILIIAIVFVSLYALIVTGMIRPIGDITVLSRIEPMVFVVVGYFLSRLQAGHYEQTLKEELRRQTLRAESAQSEKERVEVEKEGIEERMRNVRTALVSTDGFETDDDHRLEPFKSEHQNDLGTPHSGIRRRNILTAVNILGSR
jgi:hypothetical protein